MAVEPTRRELRRVVAPLARRVNLAVWLNHALLGVVIALGLYSVILILLKILWPDLAVWSLLALVLLPVSLLWAAWSARRGGRFFRERDLVEVVDHLYKNDGAVSAAFERPDLLPSSDYYARVRSAIADRLPRLDLRHYSRRLLPALLLAAVSLWIPARPPAETPESRRVLTTLTQPILEKIDQFEELLPDQQAEQLREELQELAQNQEGISREKWEAVEELDRRVDDAVAQSRQSLSGLAGGLRELSSLAGQASTAASSGELDANLEGLLNELAQSARDQKHPMSSQMRKQISDALQRLEGGQKLDSDALAQLERACDQLGQCMGEGDQPGGEEGDKPGRGGVDRGRADAPLVLGDQKTLPDGQYQDSELRNRYLDPADLVDLGITPVEPKADPGAFSPGVVRQFDRQEGSGVSRTRISPARRQVISKYFSEPEE